MLRSLCSFSGKNYRWEGAAVTQLFISTNLLVWRQKSEFVGGDDESPQTKSLHEEADDLETLKMLLPGRLKREQREDELIRPRKTSTDLIKINAVRGCKTKVPQSKAEKVMWVGKEMMRRKGDERLKLVQKEILSTTANMPSQLEEAQQKTENLGSILTDLVHCLGSEKDQANRTMNLMQVNNPPSSVLWLGKAKKGEHLSQLVQCSLDAELEEYPQLSAFFVGHKKVKKRKHEIASTVTVEDIFSVSPSFHLFGNGEELIESAEDVYDLQDINRPCNGFEVQTITDNQRWKYPVDNQADIGEDRHNFSDHVFLDHHLNDFPQYEPVRKYMELVITGLQRNPFLSYDKKIDRIMWYKEYFAKFSKDAKL